MSNSKRLLSTVLVASLQFSICTGGFLSITSAMAATLPGADGALNMSAADQDFFLCQLYTPDFAVSDATQEAGCSSGETCLQQASQSAQDRTVVTLFEPVVEAVSVATSWFETPQTHDFAPVARAGPLHEQPRLLAHSLLKRE